MLIIVVSSFLIGMVVYDLIYSFAHEVLSDNNKAILITAGIIAFAVYMCALFNVYSDSPIWGWMISYK